MAKAAARSICPTAGFGGAGLAANGGGVLPLLPGLGARMGGFGFGFGGGGGARPDGELSRGSEGDAAAARLAARMPARPLAWPMPGITATGAAEPSALLKPMPTDGAGVLLLAAGGGGAGLRFAGGAGGGAGACSS